MPDTTPLPPPECPVEGCPATIDHWHDGEGVVFVCSRQLGRACPAHEWERTNGATRCYAPRTQPSPLGALLAAADDANRAHDRLCDLAETLLPESSPVKTAENPAPAVLPTVDEAVEAVIQSMRDGGWTYRTASQAILDLIAARMPVWVPVEPGTVKPGMGLKRTDRDGGYTVFTVKHVERYGDTYLRVRGTNGFYVDLNDDGFTWEVDPRTVPAEPEDPRVAVVAHALSDILDDNGVSTCDWTAEAVDILARLDGALSQLGELS